MKTFAPLLLACCLVALSCKKQPPEKAWRGTFTALVDSVPATFAVGLKVKVYYSNLSKQHHLQIDAYDALGGDQLEILTSDTTAVTTGRYCEDGSTINRDARLAYDEKGQNFPFMSNRSATNPATINVTTLRDDLVQGSFSGNMWLLTYVPPNLMVTSVKKEIRNGRFDLKLQ